jgi:hypothetical protein
LLLFQFTLILVFSLFLFQFNCPPHRICYYISQNEEGPQFRDDNGDKGKGEQWIYVVCVCVNIMILCTKSNYFQFMYLWWTHKLLFYHKFIIVAIDAVAFWLSPDRRCRDPYTHITYISFAPIHITIIIIFNKERTSFVDFLCKLIHKSRLRGIEEPKKIYISFSFLFPLSDIV